jgi:predicted transcriptional regulator
VEGGVIRPFGDLEAAIMDVMWRTDEPASVRTVREALLSSRKLAYTTVMTVMDNLHRKGVLTRQRHGRAFLYSPAHERNEYTAMLMADVLESSTDHSATLLRFVRRMDGNAVSQLRQALDEAERTDPAS